MSGGFHLKGFVWIFSKAFDQSIPQLRVAVRRGLRWFVERNSRVDNPAGGLHSVFVELHCRWRTTENFMLDNHVACRSISIVSVDGVWRMESSQYQKVVLLSNSRQRCSRIARSLFGQCCILLVLSVECMCSQKETHFVPDLELFEMLGLARCCEVGVIGV